MKKLISYYYVFLEIILFIFLSLEVDSFYFKGILYHAIMISFIFLSLFIIIKYNKILKFKKTFYASLIFYFVLISNIYLFILLILIFFAILILNYENKFICYYFAGVSVLSCLVLPITIFFILLKFSSIGFNGNNVRNYMYEDTYYNCGKYEIFYYSGGAMDSMHFAVLERHQYIKIGNILEVGYDKQVGDTKEDYNNIKQNNKCRK